MPAAGATERQGETAFSLALVKRQGKLEQAIQTIEKVPRFLISRT